MRIRSRRKSFRTGPLRLLRRETTGSNRCPITAIINKSFSVRSFERSSFFSKHLAVFYSKKKKRGEKLSPLVLWITSYPCPDPSLALVVLLELVCQLPQLLLLIIMLKQMQRFVMQNVLLSLGPRYLLQSCLPIHL